MIIFIYFRKYTEIYVKYHNTCWKIVKTTFGKFFRCMAHLRFNCIVQMSKKKFKMSKKFVQMHQKI